MLFIDDLVAATIRYTLDDKLSLRQCFLLYFDNTVFIWTGLFRGTKNQIISRFTWEIFQTITGLISSHLINLLRTEVTVRNFHGCTVLEGAGIGGSLCLGTHILLYPRHKTGSPVCMHEYGHTLQSRASGPLYFFKYGISSLLDNRNSWAEADANNRATQFFGHQYSAIIGKRRVATAIINPKWWEYVLFFLGIGIFIIPILNYRSGK